MITASCGRDSASCSRPSPISSSSGRPPTGSRRSGSGGGSSRRGWGPAGGGRYPTPPLSERAIEAYVERAQAAPPDPYDTLTTREREVLQLTTEGLSSTLVAERLSISPRTVETHRANLMGKLNLRRQADLVRYAFEKGIVPVEGPHRAR